MQESDTVPEQPEFVNPQFSLFLLQLIKSNQQQHGLRHNDPQRYHKYCANRLRRLYVITKTLHGKRQFRKVELKVEGIKTVTFLHIPLLQAERAWAVALIRKQQLEKMAKGDKGRHTIRSNMTGRLAKSVKHANELFELSKSVCDVRTQIEICGYACNLRGQQELEKESYGEAFTFLSRAHMMFDALSQIGEPHQPSGQQSACRATTSQISDQIRVCKYQLERSGQMDADFVPAQEDVELLKGIEELRAAMPITENEDQETTVSLVWLGDTYPVQSTNAAPIISELIQTENNLSNSMDTDDHKQQHHKAYSSSLQTALKSVQDALDTADKDADAEKCEKLEALKWAIQGKQLEHVLSWGQDKVQFQQQRFEDGMLSLLASGKRASKAGGKKNDGAGGAGKLEELVKLYDEMMKAANELEQLAMDNLSGMVAEKVLSQSAFQAAMYKAYRCYYIGHSYLRKQRYMDAYALFKRVSELVQQSNEKIEDLVEPQPEHVLESLEKLKTKAFAFQVVAKAEFDASQERKTKAVQEGMENMNINEENNKNKQAKKQPKLIKYLQDNLDSWENFAGVNGKNVRIFKIPPDPEMIPMGPILLNTAEQYLEMPSLKHRYPQKQESMLSGVSRFFSFGMGTKK